MNGFFYDRWGHGSTGDHDQTFLLCPWVTGKKTCTRKRLPLTGRVHISEMFVIDVFAVTIIDRLAKNLYQGKLRLY